MELPCTVQVFDAHVHAGNGAGSYDLPLTGRNVIFNYVDEYLRLADAVRNEFTSLTLIFDSQHRKNVIDPALHAGHVQALKIHSRLQKLAHKDVLNLGQELRSVSDSIPVVIDCFFYGPDLAHQPNLDTVAELILTSSERRWILAHGGGHRMLEFMLHFRSLPNVYFELSFSLQYLKHSSAFFDIRKLLESSRGERILFGTDFPHASPVGQYQDLVKIFDEASLSNEERHKVLYANAAALFGIPRNGETKESCRE